MKYFSKTIILISVVFIFIFGVSFAKAENVSASTTTDIISAIQQQIYNLKVQLLQLQIADLQRQFLAAASDPVTNPPPAASAAPTITIINPNPVTVAVGNASVSIDINGTNFFPIPPVGLFSSSSVVYVNGSLNSYSNTHYISSNLINITLPQSYFASPGTISIQVNNTVPAFPSAYFYDSNIVNLMVVNPPATPPAPAPHITSISQSSAIAGTPNPVTITVTGTNFPNSSIVRFNGSNNAANITTIVNSPTNLTAIIPIVKLATAGQYPITIYDALSGATSDNALTFTVTTPAPTINALSAIPPGLVPSLKTVYESDFPLTINGTNFTQNSIVEFGRPSYDNKGNYLGINFQPRTNNFTLVSPQQIKITISHTDLDTSGPWDVRVRNGQATSNVVEFMVNTLPAPHISTIGSRISYAGFVAYASGGLGTAKILSDMIYIEGTNFITSGWDVSRVEVDGYLYDLKEEFQTTGQLMFSIPYFYREHPGTLNIRVYNQGSGGGLSNAVQISVVQSAEITSISPPSVTINSSNIGSNLPIAIHGTNFPSSSVIKVIHPITGGSNVTTTVASTTQLNAIIPATMLTTSRTLSIAVNDLLTPERSSDPVNFIVTYTPIAPNALGQSSVGTPATNTPTTNAPTVNTPTTNASPVALGQRSSSIRNLQVFLNTHGFVIATTGAGSPGNETNYFGPLTRNALQNFQAANGLPRTSPSSGMFGPWTRSIILGRYGVSL